ncbi:MAG: polyprenyl synthetase family protein [Bacteroidota bacterium]
MKDIRQLQQLIDDEIVRQNRVMEPRELYEPILYTLSNGGKRLRPVFVLMGCQLFSDDVEKAVRPAIGIEMFHNFTLLHDDIMDKAFLRRNLPTVHIKWDVNRAILSGDALAICSNIFISSCDKEVLPDVLRVYNTTALQVCEGQQFDLNFERMDTVTVEEYLNMIRLKTAVLIAGSLEIGALIGGAPAGWSRQVYQLGNSIGMAFQLQDDYLDIFGQADTFGKTIGGDILADKKTFLLIKALEIGNSEQAQTLKRLYSDQDISPDEKIGAVLKIFRELKIDVLTKDKVHEYSNHALNVLREIPVEEERKRELESFTRNLMDRVR